MKLSLSLWRLQKIDSAIDQNRARIKEINELINANTKIKEADYAVHVAQEKAQKLLAHQKQLEDTTEALKIKIETSDSSLYSGRIQIPKELKDLQNEVTSLKKRFGELEEELLMAMIETENADQELKTAQNHHAAVLAEVTSQFASLLGERTMLDNKIASMQEERFSALASISSEKLDLYKRLREQKKGIAVSIVEDDSCSICGSALRPAEWQAARSPSAVVFCPSCGRILYAD